MDSGILIEIIKTGTIAFLGCKITKAFQEKEISEIIAGCGWLAVGISVVKLVTPIIKKAQGFCDNVNKFFGGIDNFMKWLCNVPGLGDFIKRGMIPH